MNWTRNTIFESSNPLNPTGSSGSNDPLPIVPKANASTRTPLWATFENAQAARGTFHWNPKAKASPEVPKLYRTEVEHMEDPHCDMLNNFMRRTQVGQEPKELKGIWKNDDSRTHEIQWRHVETSAKLQKELARRRQQAKKQAKRNLKAAEAAEHAYDAGMNPSDGSVDK